MFGPHLMADFCFSCAFGLWFRYSIVSVQLFVIFLNRLLVTFSKQQLSRFCQDFSWEKLAFHWRAERDPVLDDWRWILRTSFWSWCFSRKLRASFWTLLMFVRAGFSVLHSQPWFFRNNLACFHYNYSWFLHQILSASGHQYKTR